MVLQCGASADLFARILMGKPPRDSSGHSPSCRNLPPTFFSLLLRHSPLDALRPDLILLSQNIRLLVQFCHPGSQCYWYVRVNIRASDIHRS